MKKSVLITGCNGGIGARLVALFADAGWSVIGVDKRPADKEKRGAAILHYDIAKLTKDDASLDAFADSVREHCADAPLRALINNAAVQKLGRLDGLAVDDIIETMHVNIVAPMLLSKVFYQDLAANRGCIVNIGSVHAQATKPAFSAYATSKTALHGLTRALAVDFGPDVRVNTLAPAATATDMLKAGFADNPSALSALENIHPLKRIATPDEIARIALFLASDDAGFLTGATVFADGGVLSRLHDPA